MTSTIFLDANLGEQGDDITLTEGGREYVFSGASSFIYFENYNIWNPQLCSSIKNYEGVVESEANVYKCNSLLMKITIINKFYDTWP